MLPQEVVCTENLTPWTKLLPCKSQKGLADLLVATKLLNTLFFSLSLDFKYSCSDILNCQQTQGIELSQNILVVFNPPNRVSNNFGWSFKSLFGTTITPKSDCPLASSSDILVELQSGANLTIPPQDYIFFDKKQNQIVQSKVPLEEQSKNFYARYDVKELVKTLADAPQHQKYLNVAVEYPKDVTVKSFNHNSFHDILVRRNFRGTGLIWAGLTTTIMNLSKKPIFMTYLDTIPWYFRMFLHTLRIRTRALSDSAEFSSIQAKYIHYEPARNRERPHHVEMILELPPESEVEIDFELERQFLRWTEYPPDSSHGLYISPATLTFYNTKELPANLDRFIGILYETFEQKNNSTLIDRLNDRLSLLSSSFPVRIYTDPVLVIMPTPDFSMPFNVICFVSTVISIAFGPLSNITINKATVIQDKTKQTKVNGLEKFKTSMKIYLSRFSAGLKNKSFILKFIIFISFIFLSFFLFYNTK